MAVKEGWKGRFYEDFEVGDVYRHPLGRTVTQVDNIWFTLLTQNTAGLPEPSVFDEVKLWRGSRHDVKRIIINQRTAD